MSSRVHVRRATGSERATTFRANAQIQAKNRGGPVRSKAVEAGGREAVVIQYHRSKADEFAS
jgi:hypothetical protein